MKTRSMRDMGLMADGRLRCTGIYVLAFSTLVTALSLLAGSAPMAHAARLADDPATPVHPLAPLGEVTRALERAAAEGQLPDAPLQSGSWRAVPIEGATCGRGAPYQFFFNEAASPDAGIVILLNGGGACLKEGAPPAGTTGIARSLHCMAFENFEDPFMNETLFTGLIAGIAVPQVLPIFRREAQNPFANYHFAALPYCTGDVFAGNATAAYDYDPGAGSFEVLHRGHLNVLGVLGWLYRNYPAGRHVVLTGLSAGGFGAIYNFPDVVERWSRVSLVPDSGIAPPIDDSLLAREGQRVAERWGADALLPYYCQGGDCQSSSYRLLAAHAAQHDGVSADWRPFGYIQSQQDGTLVDYLETSGCSYQLGLRRGRGEARPANLRAYLPASAQHVFHVINPLDGQGIYESPDGVSVLDWFRRVANAEGPTELPEEMVEPWLGCNEAFMPFGLFGTSR